MRTVVDLNDVMRGILVLETENNKDHHFTKVFSSAMR
jgi:hypothetical protein